MLELADKDIKAIIIMHSKKIEERLKILYGHMENIYLKNQTSRDENCNVWDEKYTG